MKGTIKSTVATSLLDMRVRVTIGNDPDTITPQHREHCEETKKSLHGRGTVWKHWGDYGHIRAVYQDAEKNLVLTVQRQNTGELFEILAAHVKMVYDPVRNLLSEAEQLYTNSLLLAQPSDDNIVGKWINETRKQLNLL